MAALTSQQELGSCDTYLMALKKFTVWPFIEKSLLIPALEIG